MSGNVLVYLEALDGVLRKPALEALGAGRALADALGVELHGVITSPARDRPCVGENCHGGSNGHSDGQERCRPTERLTEPV